MTKRPNTEGKSDKRKKIRGYSFQGLKCSKVQPIRQGLPAD